MRARLLGLLALTATIASGAELRGRVLDEQDGRPLPAAFIRLMAEGVLGQPASVRTGADGSFSIQDLLPGEYRAVVSKPGYESHGHHAESFRIAAENDRVTLTPKLRRSPLIAGRVTDAAGDPVPDVAIQLKQWRSLGGARVLQPVGSGKTDDLGWFRLYELQTGSYYLMATPRPAAATGSEALYDLAAQYYPGVEAASAASPIALDWGTTFEQADIELPSAPDTQLLGSAQFAGAGPCLKCSVMIESLDSGFQVAVQPNERGAFRIFGLAQGYYRALARNRGEGVAYGEFRQPLDRPAELPLLLSAGTTVRGRLEMEGGPDEDEGADGPILAGQPLFRRRGIRLTRLPALSGERYESRIDGPNVFLLEAAPAGDYLVEAMEPPAGGYVAEILANGAALTDWRMRIEPGTPAIEMILRVAYDGGQVSGTVDPGGAGEVPPDHTIVLLPANYSGKQGFEQYARVSGPEGAFERSGLPPGVYAVGAVRRDIRFDWADPDQRSRFESQAKTIRVGPRSSQQIQAPLLEDF